ncbi:MAG: hypothetical protein WBD31_26895 [Rubripirellula sp.]
MVPTDEDINAYQSNRQLVSFRRDLVDNAELQGFILRVSESLILLQHVRDFTLDGYLLLDRSHITNARCHPTNRFQRQLLESSGTIADVDFECTASVESWMDYLTSLADDTLVIIEQELSEPPFVHYGTFIDKDDDDFVRIHEFSGAANWDDELTLIPLEEITCVQTDTNYLRPYERYFKLNPRPQIA